MNYQTADSRLDGRNKLSRKVGNNTYLVRNSGVPGDSIHLKLHDTYIVTWYADGRTELNSGGWRTVTTKARINEFLDGFYISQVKGQWYLEKNNPNYKGWEWNEQHPEAKEDYRIQVCIYDDGLTIAADGTVTGGEPIAEAAKAFSKGNVPAPSAGVCLTALCVQRYGPTKV